MAIEYSPKVISFDLDNCLYDNQPVLEKAEAASYHYLLQAFSNQSKPFEIECFHQIKREIVKEKDYRYEDLGLLRSEALKRLCVDLKYGNKVAEKALSLFIAERSKVLIADEIQQLLFTLAQRYILVSVTNGNCDVNKTKIGQYFSKNYSPSMGFRAKPHPQMLFQVMVDFELKALDLTQAPLIHIGDSISSDGAAAEAAKIPFIFFSPYLKCVGLKESCKNLKEMLVD